MSDPSTRALALAFKHVATTERLTLLIEQATQMVNGMASAIDESDDELAPELRTAIALAATSACRR